MNFNCWPNWYPMADASLNPTPTAKVIFIIYQAKYIFVKFFVLFILGNCRGLVHRSFLSLNESVWRYRWPISSPPYPNIRSNRPPAIGHLSYQCPDISSNRRACLISDLKKNILIWSRYALISLTILNFKACHRDDLKTSYIIKTSGI